MFSSCLSVFFSLATAWESLSARHFNCAKIYAIYSQAYAHTYTQSYMHAGLIHTLIFVKVIGQQAYQRERQREREKQQGTRRIRRMHINCIFVQLADTQLFAIVLSKHTTYKAGQPQTACRTRTQTHAHSLIYWWRALLLHKDKKNKLRDCSSQARVDFSSL